MNWYIDTYITETRFCFFFLFFWKRGLILFKRNYFIFFDVLFNLTGYLLFIYIVSYIIEFYRDWYIYGRFSLINIKKWERSEKFFFKFSILFEISYSFFRSFVSLLILIDIMIILKCNKPIRIVFFFLVLSNFSFIKKHLNIPAKFSF